MKRADDLMERLLELSSTSDELRAIYIDELFGMLAGLDTLTGGDPTTTCDYVEARVRVLEATHVDMGNGVMTRLQSQRTYGYRR